MSIVDLQRKLPLDNELLKSMSSLDPKLRGNSVCTKLLRKLPTFVTNVLTEEEEEKYDLEVRKYQVHLGLPSAVYSEGGTVRLDTWWTSVVKTGVFPTLCKMALAIMSCFHGPAVEGSFNIMGDIIDPKSARMNIETFSAIQTVKYGLRASQKSALEYFERKNHLNDPIDVQES